MRSSICQGVVVAALVTVASACSSDSTGGSPAASGGKPGTGGGVASGGTVGSGGSSGAGGALGSGGTGTGGAPGTGGTATTGTGGDPSGGTGAGGSHDSGGAGGGSAGASAGGAPGAGGVGTGGTTGDLRDSSAGGGADAGSTQTGADGPTTSRDGLDVQVDVNAQDGGQGSVDGQRWADWNAFLPLASGSSTAGEPGTTADVSGHGYDAIYGFGVSFSNSAMVLSGSGDVTISSHSYLPAIDVTGSYSVSVWVTMNETSGYRTFVSADGAEVSAFYLQTRDTNLFAFTLSTSDSNDGVSQPCVTSSSSSAVAYALYHLVATRDATTGTNTLYVNGVSVGTAACPASTGVGWAASTFSIGHGRYNRGNTDYFSGSLSNLGLIGRVITADEVAALYASGPGS